MKVRGHFWNRIVRQQDRYVFQIERNIIRTKCSTVTHYRVIEKDGRDLKPPSLKQYVFPQIETFEQETVSRVIFTQDGAPPHFSCFVTDVLHERFPDAWIERGGPILWPPRSPDLSPLDFFLWGYIKNIVYAEKIRNIQHLQKSSHQPLKL